ncbi:hypothetical protein C8Q69DRAFT_465712 [Paecilomyces variotii]|uniref:Secreted protein n=1 Tax=Byssochlamys spectabilis TaxID=264951 RepID=A0A443HUD9_BYSSP|nr:hypothetical protein C8Q69DRAFT_465712 [Paecilomyces variotii]RWQ95364.1 hypothetical protein C8Q69DRAFT_465712 [Paecilomyces variotii]
MYVCTYAMLCSALLCMTSTSWIDPSAELSRFSSAVGLLSHRICHPSWKTKTIAISGLAVMVHGPALASLPPPLPSLLLGSAAVEHTNHETRSDATLTGRHGTAC